MGSHLPHPMRGLNPSHLWSRKSRVSQPAPPKKVFYMTLGVQAKCLLAMSHTFISKCFMSGIVTVNIGCQCESLQDHYTGKSLGSLKNFLDQVEKKRSILIQMTPFHRLESQAEYESVSPVPRSSLSASYVRTMGSAAFLPLMPWFCSVTDCSLKLVTKMNPFLRWLLSWWLMLLLLLLFITMANTTKA